MIKEKKEVFQGLMSIFEIGISILALAIAAWVRNLFSLSYLYTKDYIIILLSIVPLWYVLFKMTNLSRFQRTKGYTLYFMEYLFVVSIGTAILFLLVGMLKLGSISRLVLLVFAPIDFTILFLSKILIYKILTEYSNNSTGSRNLLIIADDNSDFFIDQVIQNNILGYSIRVIITDSEKITDKYIMEYSVLPTIIDIKKFIEIESIDEVVYCKSDFNEIEVKNLIYACEEIGVVFQLQSQLFSMAKIKAHINYFGETPFLTFANTPSSYVQLKLKSIFDFCFALVVIIVLSPILIIIAAFIKFSSKGPIIFKQKRVGLRRREFMVYKFRTMVQNAEELKAKLLEQNEQEGPVFKIKKDPRVTKIGSILRKTSLDELPQFFNVLKGEMSVVGPRPPIPEEVEQYERWQLRRLSMKPGITCIWQVSGRNNISFENWMRLDLQYIDNWSMSLDIFLILKTVRSMFKGTGV